MLPSAIRPAGVIPSGLDGFETISVEACDGRGSIRHVYLATLAYRLHIILQMSRAIICFLKASLNLDVETPAPPIIIRTVVRPSYQRSAS
jgi:hypothetical protein